MNKPRSSTPEYRKERYTGIYGSWLSMKQRCDNPNHSAYHNYGGRGIKYHSDWKEFALFKKDMGETYTKGLTLERVNVNGDYCPDNCKWIPKKMQFRNMRKTVWLEYQGERKTLFDWADRLGLDYSTLRSRMYRGMTTEEVLNPNLYRPRKL